MDLLAAFALVMVIEGLALLIFARVMPQLLAELEMLGPQKLRVYGAVSLALGALLYMIIRSSAGHG